MLDQDTVQALHDLNASNGMDAVARRQARSDMGRDVQYHCGGRSGIADP